VRPQDTLDLRFPDYNLCYISKHSLFDSYNISEGQIICFQYYASFNYECSCRLVFYISLCCLHPIIWYTLQILASLRQHSIPHYHLHLMDDRLHYQVYSLQLFFRLCHRLRVIYSLSHNYFL